VHNFTNASVTATWLSDFLRYQGVLRTLLLGKHQSNPLCSFDRTQTMIIYTRTEEGQLAAYSPGSVLPRKLRSLLKVIDGKTPVGVYNESLKAFGDVEGVLTSLQMAGLIRPVAQTLSSLGAVVSSDTAPAASTMVWGNTDTRQPSVPASRTFDNSGLKGQSTQVGFSPSNTSIAMQGNLARSQALGRAVDLMSNFVLTYAPEQSFLVLKELEELTDLEQLAVTLGGYEMLMAHLGTVAQEHLLLIKQILRENL
jgi:hypothetical protein